MWLKFELLGFSPIFFVTTSYEPFVLLNSAHLAELGLGAGRFFGLSSPGFLPKAKFYQISDFDLFKFFVFLFSLLSTFFSSPPPVKSGLKVVLGIALLGTTVFYFGGLEEILAFFSLSIILCNSSVFLTTTA